MPQPETRQIPLRLPAPQYEALKAYSFFARKSMNQVVVDLVTSFLSGPGQAQQFDAMLERARDEYRVTLDKLAEL